MSFWDEYVGSVVSVGWLGYITIDMYKGMVKTYNLLNSIWQTHATVDLCVSVFSTAMHRSSLGARPRWISVQT